MNWMCSSLDGYQLVSNSGAHSPPMLGREAATFTTAMDFFSIAEALRAGDGQAGTIEFYPEESKYHLDGHRKCGIRLEPGQTRERDGACPECHKPLAVGVCTGSRNSLTARMATGRMAPLASIIPSRSRKSLARSSRWGRRARA